MKLLNDLMGIFPREDFWQRMTFDKVSSLAILRSEYGMQKNLKNCIWNSLMKSLKR